MYNLINTHTNTHTFRFSPLGRIRHENTTSYESQPGAAKGQDNGALSKGIRGFEWADAGSGAGLHSSSRPPQPWTSAQQFSFFFLLLHITPSLRNAGLKKNLDTSKPSKQSKGLELGGNMGCRDKNSTWN